MRWFVCLFAFLSLSMPAIAQDETSLRVGQDFYLAGFSPHISQPAGRSVFLAGFSPTIDAGITQNAHMAGFSVSVRGDIGADLYAVGNTVTLDARVAGDATLAGSTVVINDERGIGGNLRVGAASVTLAAPVQGSALIGAASTTISAPINGDLHFSGNSLEFAEGAKVSGDIVLTADHEITVPDWVAPASRISLNIVENPVTAPASPATPIFWAIGSVLVGIVVLLAVAIGWLTLFPNTNASAYQAVMTRPVSVFGLGMLAIAAAIGLIPVLLATLVGAPLVLIELFVLLLTGLIGFFTGTWIIAKRIFRAFSVEADTPLKSFGMMVAGLVCIGMLSIIPVLGWLIQLSMVFIGTGALAMLVLKRWLELRPRPSEKANTQLQTS